MYKYDLGFGDPVLVREALCNFIEPVSAINENYLNLGYGNKSGNPAFAQSIKRLIKDFTGKSYKHTFITNGATGGVNVALKAIRPLVERTINAFYVKEVLDIDKPLLYYRKPAFHYYKDMATYSGYQITDTSAIAMVKLIDSPRNPTGELAMDLEDGSRYVIWDAAYHSPIYNKLFMNIIPTHDIMVGSFGKTTGLTGLRLGWVSTDDDMLAKEIEKSLHADSLGVSQYSQMAGSVVLAKLPFDKFSKKAASMIDDNREEFSKIKNLLYQEVPSTGMFYYAPVSGYLEKAFKEMGVGFVPGPTLEGSPGWGRFSLAQSREVVRDFVKELQRRDG